jgi:hypothetical protein
VVLGVRTWARFAEMHIFRQDTSSALRTPHSVSKALGRHCTVLTTLLQGLRQNSNIYGGCRRTKQQGWQNFPTCVCPQTVDISNPFQYPQWNFPTLSNMNIGIFLNISLHIVEFFNIFQHICIEESPLCWF